MARSPINHPPPEPALGKLPPGIRSFAGHTDTVLDVVGRIGAPPSLVIFTEGNHLMVALGDYIIGAFPSWAKSQLQYADLNVDNIVVSTLPQPILVEAIRAGGIGLGNLTLEMSRQSAFYPTSSWDTQSLYGSCIKAASLSRRRASSVGIDVSGSLCARVTPSGYAG